MCNGPCATNGPPLMATEADKDSGDYSVITRDDSKKQWAVKVIVMHNLFVNQIRSAVRQMQGSTVDMSYVEVAKITGVLMDTVMSRLSRARSRLTTTNARMPHAA